MTMNLRNKFWKYECTIDVVDGNIHWLVAMVGNPCVLLKALTVLSIKQLSAGQEDPVPQK